MYNNINDEIDFLLEECLEIYNEGRYMKRRAIQSIFYTWVSILTLGIAVPFIEIKRKSDKNVARFEKHILYTTDEEDIALIRSDLRNFKFEAKKKLKNKLNPKNNAEVINERLKILEDTCRKLEAIINKQEKEIKFNRSSSVSNFNINIKKEDD